MKDNAEPSRTGGHASYCVKHTTKIQNTQVVLILIVATSYLYIYAVSILQRLTVVVVFFILTDRASTIPSNMLIHPRPREGQQSWGR